MRSGPATSLPRCCPSTSGSWRPPRVVPDIRPGPAERPWLSKAIEMVIHPLHGYWLELLHRPGSRADANPARPRTPHSARGTGTWRST
jgi:hypothetical protein